MVDSNQVTQKAIQDIGEEGNVLINGASVLDVSGTVAAVQDFTKGNDAAGYLGLGLALLPGSTEVKELSTLAKSEEILSRLGVSKESVARLAKKAAEAEEKLGIHGISATAGTPSGAASSAPRSSIEAHFTVHNTPTRSDPLHRTIELVKPVTQAVADVLNTILGRL